MAQLTFGEDEGLDPIKLHVRKPRLIALVDRLFDEAHKYSDEARRGENEEDDPDAGPKEPEDEDDWEDRTRVPENDRAESRKAKTPKSRSTVSVRFQDVDSSRSFDFYVAPSKKDSSLYFVAVYQGRKPLRYADVDPQTILDFNQKLAQFSVEG